MRSGCVIAGEWSRGRRADGRWDGLGDSAPDASAQREAGELMRTRAPRQCCDPRDGLDLGALRHVDQVRVQIDVLHPANGDQPLDDRDRWGAHVRPAEQSGFSVIATLDAAQRTVTASLKRVHRQHKPRCVRSTPQRSPDTAGRRKRCSHCAESAPRRH